MYNIRFREVAFQQLEKATKRDFRKSEIIKKKLLQVRENPYQFKPLRAPLHGLRRAHVDKSFVIAYSIDELQKTVIIEGYDHHDNIYKK
ncbi:TPA: type II toxin-antitoxin system RelE/ParE family toxin [archaeon]|nr:type II toxin-antitoxin system RelE/ParE family toxin [Candidatus Naiadarchaeales archaeon SRR2090153.bin461]HIK02608.1 type II toxin-antitoxin system RelE/ParE family toxin [Candidatus Naiadarchaeales archaeon SRR2090159.bin1288]